MANEFSVPNGMIFVGLLTHRQKQLGYFVTQDEDFIYLYHRNGKHPRPVGVFLYETATVKEIRDKANEDIYGEDK